MNTLYSGSVKTLLSPQRYINVGIAIIITIIIIAIIIITIFC